MDTPTDWVIIEMCDDTPQPVNCESYISNNSRQENDECEDYDEEAGAGGDGLSEESEASSSSYTNQYGDDSDADTENATNEESEEEAADSDDEESVEETDNEDDDQSISEDVAANLSDVPAKVRVDLRMVSTTGKYMKAKHELKRAVAKKAREVHDNLYGIQPVTNTCRSDGTLEVNSNKKLTSTKEQNLSADQVLAISDCYPHNEADLELTKLNLDKTDVPGDALEMHISRLEIHTRASFEREVPSTECSTRFDFTPAATRFDFTPANRKSSNDDSGTRGSGALSGMLSVSSGRKNARTKNDVEVRYTEAPHREAKPYATQFNSNVKCWEATLQHGRYIEHFLINDIMSV